VITGLDSTVTQGTPQLYSTKTASTGWDGQLHCCSNSKLASSTRYQVDYIAPPEARYKFYLTLTHGLAITQKTCYYPHVYTRHQRFSKLARHWRFTKLSLTKHCNYLYKRCNAITQQNTMEVYNGYYSSNVYAIQTRCYAWAA
jgi:hypothetical protein